MSLDINLARRFATIVGARNALSGQSDIEPYVTERRGLFPGHSSLVLLPGSADEVSRIMALATETGTAIVPQGGNTGLVGGGVPDASGTQIVMSLKRMNRIREVDAASNTITVEAGTILHDIQNAADEADRLFPLALGSQGTCQIGGKPVLQCRRHRRARLRQCPRSVSRCRSDSSKRANL